MKKNLFFRTIYVLMFLLLSFGITAEETGNSPVAVSPGSEKEMATIWQNCPTFSWSSIDQAASYRVAIFASPDGKIAPYESMALMSTPVISKQIAGPALSWTLSAQESLKTGSIYAWYVQALDAPGTPIGSWSGGKIFKVEQETRFIDIREKLEEKSKLPEMEQIDAEIKNTPGISGILGTEGTYNTFYGWQAGASASGTMNTLIGNSAGYILGRSNTGDNNTILGHWAGRNNTSGDDNTFVGHTAGQQNTSGIENTFIGRVAGESNTTASANTYVGYSSGGYNNTTTGIRNSFMGLFSGSNCTGIDNIAIGHYAGQYNQYTNNGSYNSLFGDEAGYSVSSGNYNTCLGYYAGYHNTTGYHNAFFGYRAGFEITSGHSNTFIGNNAGYNNDNAGTLNVLMGYNAGYNEAGSNKLYIDNSIIASPLLYGEFDNGILTVNGKLGIGTKTPDYPIELETTGQDAVFVTTRTSGAQNFLSATDSYAQFGARSDHPVRILANNAWQMQIDTDDSLEMANGASCTSGGTWTNASSRTLKENIEDLGTGEAMATLSKLNPVKYNYKVDKTDKHVGFIAEDVPELVAAAGRKGLSPMDITAVITKVVQELEIENREYTKILSELQERVATLEKK